MKNNIALERIYRLIELAEKEEKEKNYDRVKRYIEIAKKIGTSTRTKIPTELKKKICRKCNRMNLKSIKEEKIEIMQCLECGNRKTYSIDKKSIQKIKK